MTPVQFREGFSRSIQIQIIVTVIVIGLIAVAFWPAVKPFYFTGGDNILSMVLNGIVLGLFLFGVIAIIRVLHFYAGQELSLKLVLANIDNDAHPMTDIPTSSLIGHRFFGMQATFRNGMTPDHAALAQSLVARESVRGTAPRFISNTLILTGVFGTLVSLSFALTGAHNLIEGAGSMTGMAQVIQGMSTALSTTITAVMCFFVFNYFYARTLDAQTRVVATIEELTSKTFMPIFRTNNEQFLEKTHQLIQALQVAADSLEKQQAQTNSAQLDEVVTLLKQGFRLDR